MPMTVNGIGTGYSGSANIAARRDQCPHCGRVTDLTSYDTRLFVVVVFIPVIPLGRKRIIDQCSACRRHYALPIEDWERQRTEKLGGAAADWGASPDDPALAARAVGAAIGFQAKDEFLGMTRSFTPALAKNAEFMALVGDAYGHFGMRAEQAAAYRASLAAAKSPQVECALGVRLLYDGAVDEGVELVRSALHGGVEHPAGSVFAAATVLQSLGRHGEALHLLEELRAKEPAIASDKAFAKLKKASEKNRASGKPVKGLRLPEPGWVNKPKRTNLSLKGWGWLGGSAAAALLLLFIGLGIYNTLSPDVWLVNGLSVPAKVSIDGQTLSVPPMGAVRARVSQGTHAVRVVEPAGMVPDETVEIGTNLFLRPFTKPTFAINPDRLAHLLESDYVYAPRGHGSAITPGWTLHHGRTLYLFSVDYPFQQPPQTIQRSSSSGSTKLSTVEVYRQMETEDLLDHVYSTEGSEAARELTSLGLARDPWNRGYLHGAALLAPADVLKIVTPLLDRRPVLTESHRLYQEHQQRVDPSVNLRDRYAERLAVEPGNPALKYLLGRVSGPAERDRLYAEAASAKPPEPAAVSEWANRLLDRGDFQRVLVVATAAREAGVWRDDVAAAHRYALAALGRNEEATQLPEMLGPVRGLTGSSAEDKVCLLAAAGRFDQAKALAAEVARTEINRADEMTGYLLSVAEYARGDTTAAAAALSGGGPALEVRRLLLLGKRIEAGQAIDAIQPERFDLLLHAGAAAVAAGDLKEARQYATRAAQLMERLGREGRTMARLLRGKGECTTEALNDAVVHHKDRGAFMLLVAAANPDEQAEPLRMAAVMSRTGFFPSHFVRQGVERLKRP